MIIKCISNSVTQDISPYIYIFILIFQPATTKKCLSCAFRGLVKCMKN